MAKKTRPASAEPLVPKAPRRVGWIGAAKAELIGCPAAVKADAGHQLFLIQNRVEPTVAIKPIHAVGDGCLELIINDKDGWYRVLYVAKFDDVVYVLHAFQKKSNRTPKTAIEVGQQRYQKMLESRKAK